MDGESNVRWCSPFIMFKSSFLTHRKQILSLLTNRWAVLCFLCLAIQEFITASSSLWLVKIVENITAKKDFIIYLFIYLGSLLLPCIPWCFAFICKTSWHQEAQRAFINAFVDSNRNNIGEWGNKGIREQKMAIITSEGPQLIYLLLDYLFYTSAYALSVFFNIMALSIVVEPLFAVAFLVSMTAVIVIMKLRRRAQRQLTQKAMTARIDLGQSLLGAWDNVLIGNNYNFNLWQERTQQRMTRCLQKNVDLERFDQIMAILVSLITMIPALIVVIYFVFKNYDNTPLLASLFVTLPILFLILSYTYQLLGYVFRWTMHKSKLMALYRSIQPSRDSHLEMAKKIKWDKIQFTNQVSLAGPLTSHHDIIQHTAQPGRITLRGENGSGKSTALILVKNGLGDRAFLLPTHNQLNFASEKNKYSTGESLRMRLTEILEKVDVDVLLLDEWDANLDMDNREKLSKLIDEIAEKKCVIEVRHR